MKRLLTLVAVIEAVTGLALMVAPSLQADCYSARNVLASPYR